jgi:hypothetical protein
MVLSYAGVARYCTVVVLRIVLHNYTIVSLENVAYYTVVLLQTIGRDYIMVFSNCYIEDTEQFVLLHYQPAPCMYLQYFLSSSPRFYIPCLHVQPTLKSYKMYSSVLSDIFASGGNDMDHSHVF